MTNNIPAGFAPIDFNMPFMDLIGPVYHLQGAEILHLAMRVEKRHCNSLGTVHGGLLATLADIASVRALVQKVDNGKRAFSLNLNLDYIGTAHEGAWLEAHVQLRKESGSIGFTTCEIREGERLVMIANGTFKFVVPRNS